MSGPIVLKEGARRCIARCKVTNLPCFNEAEEGFNLCWLHKRKEDEKKKQ